MSEHSMNDQDRFDYGEFSIGPLQQPDFDRLDNALKISGLALPVAVCEDPVAVTETIEGFMVVVQGEGVLGYLVSVQDNMEAERAQLLQFGLELLRPGGRIRIEGFHQVGDRTAIHVETVITRLLSNPKRIEIQKRMHSRRFGPKAEGDTEAEVAV